MFKKIVMLNRQTHANKKVLPVKSFKFAEKSYMASLMVNEFAQAAATYPIVFIKDKEDFRPFALMGLKNDENLFVASDGHWQADYIPAIIRRYPFILGKTEGQPDLKLCIDEESEFVSDDNGEPLFDKDGNPTNIIENVKKYLTELHNVNLITEQFTRELQQHNLLVPLNMQIRNTNGPAQNIQGCFGVNEKDFNSLSDDVFLEFRKRGILPLVYAHLLSLAQIARLIRLKNEQH